MQLLQLCWIQPKSSRTYSLYDERVPRDTAASFGRRDHMPVRLLNFLNSLFFFMIDINMSNLFIGTDVQLKE